MHWGGQNLKFPVACSIQKRRGKQIKNYGKTGIFTQNRISRKPILVFGVTLKQMNIDYMKLPLNVYIDIFYT